MKSSGVMSRRFSRMLAFRLRYGPYTFSMPLLMTALVLITSGCLGCGGSTGINPGELVPQFELRTLDGKTISRSSLKGRKVVLTFWASWCEPCIRELPSLERLHIMLAAHNAQVVSIGIDDSVTNLKAEVEKAGVSFPVLVDDKGLVNRRFQVKGVPETFLLSEEGKVVSLVDTDGKVEIKLRGPREWDSPELFSAIKSALEAD